jgi:hypothetical protein
LQGKTWNHANTIKQIFQDRINVTLGLTKNEAVALYNNCTLHDVINMRPTARDKIWGEMCRIRKVLRKEGIMAVVAIDMPRGTVLDDRKLKPSFGKRELGDGQTIYHKCMDKQTALYVKSQMDKIARGIVQVEEQVMEITDREIEQKPIMTVMNGQGNHTTPAGASIPQMQNTEAKQEEVAQKPSKSKPKVDWSDKASVNAYMKEYQRKKYAEKKAQTQ